MSNFLIGLMLGIGVGGWIYNKIYNRTGGSKPRAIATAVIAGILAFMAMITVLRFVPS